MCAGEQKMSKVTELKTKIQEQLDAIDVQKLSEKSNVVGYFHDRVVPILNEIMTLSASEAKDYEDAYRLTILKIRAAIESIATEKRNADINLMTSIGKKNALESVLSEVQIIDEESQVQPPPQRADVIAEKIQSGSYDPDVPRKIGTRPEKIKDIRAAKATLFGASTGKSNSEE